MKDEDILNYRYQGAEEVLSILVERGTIRFNEAAKLLQDMETKSTNK